MSAAPVKITRICYTCSKCGLVAAFEEQPCPLCACRADNAKLNATCAKYERQMATLRKERDAASAAPSRAENFPEY